MDSLVANLFIGLTGRAKGTTASSAATCPIRANTGLNISLSSTGTGGSKANSALGTGTSRTLAASTSVELDFFSFTSILNETSASMTKGRIFYMLHLLASTASSITFGNPSGNPFKPFNMGATATMDLLPGEFIIFGSPTTTGHVISNTRKTWKVLNNDATNAATYELGLIGEV